MVVYRTINLINGKIYIGLDSKNNPKYFGSGVKLLKAINKYGKSNFKKEILEECNSVEELHEREKFWIKELKSQNRNIGYNIHPGGNSSTSVKHTEETRKNISKGRKSWNYSDEQKEEISKRIKEYWKDPEYVAKIKKARKEIKPNFAVKVCIFGKTYNSFNEASIDLGINSKMVGRRCRSKNPLFKDWTII